MNRNHGQNATEAVESAEPATAGAAVPHEWEFCSPEPEPIPARGDGTNDEGGQPLGARATSSEIPETETIGELWLE
jgi:hypothetical protein